MFQPQARCAAVAPYDGHGHRAIGGNLLGQVAEWSPFDHFIAAGPHHDQIIFITHVQNCTGDITPFQ